jgi:predicted lysophospholipase L1 biosynthesis ABC-type transport system permease subunit
VLRGLFGSEQQVSVFAPLRSVSPLGNVAVPLRPASRCSTESSRGCAACRGSPLRQLCSGCPLKASAVPPPLRLTDAVQTMEQVQAATAASRRDSMQVLGGFALLALLLSAVGICGVMAYLVSQRTREIGIRMALGARAGSVVRLILSDALMLAAIGVASGAVAALLLTRFIRGMLFGISPTDQGTFVAIAVTLGLTAAMAALTPARRAARVDPMTALRAE